ncbi:MAG: serine/threonine-protein kinase [Planctomycetota bacterium]
MGERGAALLVGRPLAASEFQSEVDAYLQSRLKLLTGFGAALGAFFFAAAQVERAVAVGLHDGMDFEETEFVILGAVAAMALLHLLVRRLRAASRALVAVDAAATLLAVGACLALYEIGYDGGPWRLVAVLCLLVLSRAVIVPSSARRTLLLSFPAAAGVALLQISHGRIYVEDGIYYAERNFWAVFLWDQFVLVAGLGIAVLCSRVNFALRLQALRAKRLGQYVIEEKIGQGAMGEVHRATHALLKRPTAIKILRAEMSGEDKLRRFEREVRHTSRLTHPNTISIYDYGQTADGLFYYAMELLRGKTLQEIVDRAGPMPPARVLHVLVQACGALAEAHDAGLVHRDIKPGNLMLCGQGGDHDVLKVLDFGLVKDIASADAKMTLAGALCGTPETISPEAIVGAPATAAADLYALGAVGCFLLTGKGIFDARSAAEYLTSHLQADPVPPSARDPAVPKDLEAALLGCLAKEPGLRPAGARALRAELLRCADAGRWTQEDAAAWWKSFDAALNPPRPA